MIVIRLLIVAMVMAIPLIAGNASPEEKRLVIVAVGDLDKKYLENLQKPLEEQYNMKSEIGAAIPKETFKDFWNEKRNQYNGGKMLAAIQKSHFPAGATRLLVVVDEDLYDANLNYIFGIASVASKTAIFSLHRLKAGVKAEPDDETFKKRALTEAVHELGHTYSLMHCKDKHCVMFFSNMLKDTDEKGFKFCPACAKKAGLR